jgi:hypothetical protein
MLTSALRKPRDSYVLPHPPLSAPSEAASSPLENQPDVSPEEIPPALEIAQNIANYDFSRQAQAIWGNVQHHLYSIPLQLEKPFKKHRPDLFFRGIPSWCDSLIEPGQLLRRVLDAQREPQQVMRVLEGYHALDQAFETALFESHQQLETAQQPSVQANFLHMCMAHLPLMVSAADIEAWEIDPNKVFQFDLTAACSEQTLERDVYAAHLFSYRYAHGIDLRHRGLQDHQIDRLLTYLEPMRQLMTADFRFNAFSEGCYDDLIGRYKSAHPMPCVDPRGITPLDEKILNFFFIHTIMGRRAAVHAYQGGDSLQRNLDRAAERTLSAAQGCMRAAGGPVQLQVEELKLRDYDLGSEEAFSAWLEWLVEAFPNLQRLHLADCALSAAHALALGKAMPRFRQLAELSLRHVQPFSDGAVKAIKVGFFKTPTLRSLHIEPSSALLHDTQAYQNTAHRRDMGLTFFSPKDLFLDIPRKTLTMPSAADETRGKALNFSIQRQRYRAVYVRLVHQVNRFFCLTNAPRFCAAACAQDEVNMVNHPSTVAVVVGLSYAAHAYFAQVDWSALRANLKRNRQLLGGASAVDLIKLPARSEAQKPRPKTGPSPHPSLADARAESDAARVANVVSSAQTSAGDR